MQAQDAGRTAHSPTLPLPPAAGTPCKQQRKWESIQALRAVAAASVALGHILLSSDGTAPPPWLWAVHPVTSPLCHAGVDLFFVISGAIMYLVLRETRGGVSDAGRFMVRRGLRIYPLFWIALTAVIFLTCLPHSTFGRLLKTPTLAGFSEYFAVCWMLVHEVRFPLIVGFTILLIGGLKDRRILGIGAAIMIAALFVSTGIAPALPKIDPPSFSSILKVCSLVGASEYFPIGWTLMYEIRFYLVVGLAVALVRNRNDVRFLAIGAAIVMAIVLAAIGIAPKDPSTNPMMLEFLLGAAMAAIALRTNKYATTCGMVALVGLIATVVSLNLGSDLRSTRVYGFGIPAALALYSAMALEASERLVVPSWLSRAGDASYSIYLWHYPVILVMLLVFSRTSAPRIAYYVATLTVTLVVAMASWNFIERPILQAASKRPSRRREVSVDRPQRMAA